MPCCIERSPVIYITKTRLYNIDRPQTPLLYSKTGVYRGIHFFFFISAQKDRLWVIVRTGEAVLTVTHNLCFEQKYEKKNQFLSQNFQFFFLVEIFYIFE